MTSPESLVRVSIITFFVVVLALLAVMFFQADAAATKRCIDKGNSVEECGWR